MRTTPTSHWEIATIVAICFGYYILISINAVFANFPRGTITENTVPAMVVLDFILITVALAVLKWRHYPLANLLPRPDWRGSAIAVGLAIAGICLGMLATWFFPVSQRLQYQDIVGSHKLGLLSVLVLSVVNGLYEEVFLLGYLQRELMPHGAAFAVGASLLVRVLYHAYQGHVGATAVMMFGLVLGVYFLRTGNLWPPALAHVLADIVALLSM
jgi:membrane protease YdiL (CAAX protease family)